MLSLDDAREIIERAIPDGDVEVGIPYGKVYIFQVYLDKPSEEGFDPFYSVHQDTGDVAEFSILTDGDVLEINNLFEAANAARQNERR